MAAWGSRDFVAWSARYCGRMCWQAMSSCSVTAAVTVSDVCSGMEVVFANPLSNTHSTDYQLRILHYPWHPWYGQEVLTRKGTGKQADDSYLCLLKAMPPGAQRTQIPRWMFDSAGCALMRQENTPYAELEALRQLNRLLEAQRTAWTASVVVQAQLPCQSCDGGANEQAKDPHVGRTDGAFHKETRSSSLGESERSSAHRSVETHISASGANSCRRRAKKLSAHRGNRS
jgi:hypothetical protein